MALITGKTLMDRQAIPAVQDTVEQGALDTLALHAAFHGKGRLRHAVTPRFAITSTEAQLQMAGEVLQECEVRVPILPARRFGRPALVHR